MPQENIPLLVSNFKTIKEVIVLTIAIIIILSIIVRTGSAHFIRERIWTILGGPKEFKNEHLRKKWDEIKDLESINYKTGIKFKSLKDACRAFFWIEKNNISFSELSKAAQYFDPEKTKLKDLRFKTRENIAVTIALIAILTSIALLLFTNNFSDRAFLSVKKTNTNFVTDGTTATPWVGKSWHADRVSCQSDITGIESKHDKEVICDLLSGSGVQFIHDSIELQKKIIFGLMMILIITLYNSIRRFDKVHTAKILYEKTTPDIE